MHNNNNSNKQDPFEFEDFAFHDRGLLDYLPKPAIPLTDIQEEQLREQYRAQHPDDFPGSAGEDWFVKRMESIMSDMEMIKKAGWR